MVDERSLREQIVQVGQWMYAKGFICGSDGNISARLGPGRFLLTPSGLPKGMLDPRDLLVVDDTGRRVGGTNYRNRDAVPTSELPMHLEAYRQRPDVEAVVHAHPPFAVALSIAGIAMDGPMLPETIVFLGSIPTAPYATPSSTENVTAIRQLIQEYDGLILQRHGSLTVGKNLIEAFLRLETLEKNAEILFRLHQLGAGDNYLPSDQAAKLWEQRRRVLEDRD